MPTKNEIFSQRLIKAVIWNIVLQTLLAFVLIFILQTDLLHPATWITSTFKEILGLNMIMNIVLLGLVSTFQAYIYGNYYSLPLPKFFTRFSMFLNVFTLQNIMFSVLYALSGFFTIELYSSLAKSKYSSLKKSCDRYDGQCLMEQSLFLQIGGMWIGMYYFLNIHAFGNNILIFPHIYQGKIQQIKLATSKILSSGLKDSIAPVFYFCCFYFLWGSKARNVICDVYSLYLEDPPLDSLFNMIKSGIWVGLWLYTSLFYVSIYTMRSVFNIILTEPMRFPITSESRLTLHEALSEQFQFNGHLGALDLKLLALTDKQRRLQIFTLSQPGGHPRNWSNILEKSLTTLTLFNKELETINDVQPIATEKSTLNMDKSYNIVESKTLRNLTQSPQLLTLKNQTQEKEAFEKCVDIVKSEISYYLDKLCQKPGINYFFGELTDTKLKVLLAQAQPVIWTCEGLSFIVAASLKEDKYGVVLNDISTVITMLVNLKINLDKLTRLGLVPRRNILHDMFAIKMKSALMSAVKRSLYKIIITFSKYLHEIPLSPEVQMAIHPFLVCKEA